MGITELKAQAYDTLAQIEMLQQNLARLNQMISQEMSKENQDDKNNSK